MDRDPTVRGVKTYQYKKKKISKKYQNSEKYQCNKNKFVKKYQYSE
jgi:hypothetical protein